MKFNVEVLITGGSPEKPIRGAEVSIKGLDGVDLSDLKRSDRAGAVRFQDLKRADVLIVVVSTSWKTLRTTRRLLKAHETVKLRLQPL